MIKLQNFSQLSVFNNMSQKNSVNVSNPVKNNRFERSPQCDCVNFTGNDEQDEEKVSFIDVDYDDIHDIPPENIFTIPEDELETIEVYDDIDANLRQCLEDDVIEQRRKQDELDQFNNDMIIYGYGAVLPDMIEGQNISGMEPCDFHEDINLMADVEDFNDTGSYMPEDDYSGLDDFGY